MGGPGGNIASQSAAADEQLQAAVARGGLINI